MTSQPTSLENLPRQSSFVDATDLEGALEALHEHGSDLTVLAGGTDVMVQYLRGDLLPRGLLHIRRLHELKESKFGRRTVIGALTTHWQLVTDQDILIRHPALAEAAATVGGRQTQNAGTIAGNLVNASPAADLLPVMLVSDGVVTLTSSAETRDLPLADFVLGRRSTARKPDELVTGLSFEPLAESAGEVYLKIGRRHAMEVAIVGLAARLAFDAEGNVTEARVALASVAPKAFRAHLAEQRLVGTKLDDESMREAAELVRQAAHPIDDARATADYRRRLLPGLLRDAVTICRRRAFNKGGATEHAT
jgi:carbon-monoxide dehydrogenase medium subunit